VLLFTLCRHDLFFLPLFPSLILFLPLLSLCPFRWRSYDLYLMNTTDWLWFNKQSVKERIKRANWVWRWILDDRKGKVQRRVQGQWEQRPPLWSRKVNGGESRSEMEISFCVNCIYRHVSLYIWLSGFPWHFFLLYFFVGLSRWSLTCCGLSFRGEDRRAAA